MHHIVTWRESISTKKRAARIILDAAPDAPSKALFEKLGWLSVFDLVTLHKCILLYKIFNNQSPSYLQDLFICQTSNAYTLRSESNFDLRLPKHRTNLFKNSLQYSGVHIWNSLPLNIRCAPSLPVFKRNVEKYIFINRT